MSHLRFKFNLSYPLTMVGALITLLVGYLAFSNYYFFLRLTNHTDAQIERLKVIKKSSSAYPIQAWYTFEFQDKTYQGNTVLRPPYHLNRLSAQKALSQLNEKEHRVWFDPRNPSISSLEKQAPIKKFIYFLISLGVTLYFWVLETHSKIRNPAK